MKTITTKVPGKLYLAGEYAVVTPNQPAILMAVDRFLTVEIKKSSADQGSFYSEKHTDKPINWHLNAKGLFQFDDVNHSFPIVESTIQTVLSYLIEKINIKSDLMDIRISSDLDFEDGKKIGLGSSAAISVALVRGLLEYYSTSLTDLEVFKLACIAHIRLNSRGSFGDIASITYTGWIYYTSFNREFIRKQMEKYSIVDLISRSWPGLEIQPLKLKTPIDILVGWTGQPASTEELVEQAQDPSKQNDEFTYDHFLLQSRSVVNRLKNALENHSLDEVFRQVAVGREVLLTLQEQKSILIETENLYHLVDIARSYGYAAKTSGAGGGDCGIALVTSTNRHVDQVKSDWEQAGILPLDLTVYTKKD